ncbi:MAG: phosphomannomutase/phosphoglucomutase [bacterium]
MKINRLIFREYDIRGIADDDLKDDVLRAVADAVASKVREKGIAEIIIGRDGRLSSPRISKTLIDEFLKCGLNVIDIGIVASPVFYFACHKWNVNGGIMITGSHNPPEYNGMKISVNQATIYGEEIKDILLRLVKSEKSPLHPPLSRRDPFGTKGEKIQGCGKCEERDIIPEYRNFLEKDIKIGRKLKIAVDSGNGVGGGIIIPAMKALGLTVISLFENVDGNFPNHFPDPTVPEYLKTLTEAVFKEKADFGVAFDGDADRIGVIDEKGNIIWGDKLMAIFAKILLAESPGGKIVFEVKCSKALPEAIEKYGGVPVMSRTGHSPIEARIKKEGALFGGEMSGHIYFNDRYFGYDDALYTALRLCELVSSGERRLSSYLEEVPSYPITPEIRIDCPDEIKFGVVDKLSAIFQKTNDVITIDGARIIFEDGWGLCRASNTQPVLVLRFEADTQDGVSRNRKKVMDVLNKILAEEKK